MNILAEDWFYMLALILFVAMHLFGLGCRRSHSSQRRHQDRSKDARNGADAHRPHD